MSNIPNMSQQSHFHQLINGGRGDDYESIINLIDQDPTVLRSYGGVTNTTALSQAIFAGNHSLLSFLLDVGVDVNQPNKQPSYHSSYLPLHCAIHLNDIVMVKSLLAYGADPNLSIYSQTEVDDKNARQYAEYMVFPDIVALFE